MLRSTPPCNGYAGQSCCSIAHDDKDTSAETFPLREAFEVLIVGNLFWLSVDGDHGQVSPEIFLSL